jgi:hypothetical protein
MKQVHVQMMLDELLHTLLALFGKQSAFRLRFRLSTTVQQWTDIILTVLPGGGENNAACSPIAVRPQISSTSESVAAHTTMPTANLLQGVGALLHERYIAGNATLSRLQQTCSDHNGCPGTTSTAAASSGRVAHTQVMVQRPATYALCLSICQEMTRPQRLAADKEHKGMSSRKATNSLPNYRKVSAAGL